MSNTRNNKIYSLNAIRFILAVFILLSHAGKIANVGEPGLDAIYAYAFNNGGMLVSFFFVLSGFSMTIGYKDRFTNLSLKSYLTFIKKRLIKFYPLYAFTMLFAFFYSYATSGWSLDYLKDNYVSLIATLTLTQTIFYQHALTLNAVGWFMATMFIIYLFVPLFIYLFNKIKNSPIWYGLIILGGYLLSVIVAHALLVILPNLGLEVSIVRLIVDAGPYVRVFQYIVGMGVAYLFLSLKDKINVTTRTATILELLIILLFVFISYIDMNIVKDRIINDVYNTPMVVATIFIFAFDKGIFSKGLSLNTMQQLGNISMEFYLLHYIPVYKMGMLDWLYDLFAPGGAYFACFVIIFIWIVITVALAFLWAKIQGYIFIKVKENRIVNT